MGASQSKAHFDNILFENKLLTSLSPEGRERVRSKLKLIDLAAKEVLYHPGQHITNIYFPETCVIVMLTVMSDGRYH